jgi:hypothetical protein
MGTETKTETIVLTGASGKKYTFYVYDWGAEFKKVGGVYAVLKAVRNQAGSLTYYVIYIGQTGDLSERFDNHHKVDCFRRNGANRISAFSEGNEKSRLAAESDLIAAYDPPCNDKG